MARRGCSVGGVDHHLCLSAVCLSAFSRKIYRSALDENFIKDVSLDKEVPDKFWQSSAFGSISGKTAFSQFVVIARVQRCVRGHAVFCSRGHEAMPCRILAGP